MQEVMHHAIDDNFGGEQPYLLQDDPALEVALDTAHDRVEHCFDTGASEIQDRPIGTVRQKAVALVRRIWR